MASMHLNPSSDQSLVRTAATPAPQATDMDHPRLATASPAIPLPNFKLAVLDEMGMEASAAKYCRVLT